MRRFLARPPVGRVFTVAKRIRSTDVTPSGRLRFDALARYLQQAAEDDLVDAGWNEPYDWAVRKVAVAVREFPGSAAGSGCIRSARARGRAGPSGPPPCPARAAT